MKKSAKLVIVALIIVGLLSAYLFMQNSDRLNTEKNDNNTEQTESTKSKQEAAEDNNQDTPEQSDSDKKTQPEEESAEPTQQDLPRPIITYAGNTGAGSPSDEDYIVSAFVQSSVNGTCELVLTKDTEKIVRTSETFHQPSYKQCDDFVFDDSELSTGKWTAEVRFIKDNLKSEFSESYEFEVN